METTKAIEKVNGTAASTQALPPAAAIVEMRGAEVVRLNFETVQGFEAMQRAAKLLAASTLVPEQYRGPSNVPNCVIALNMSTRIGADPLMVMQNLYVVHGRPAWSSQFLIAAVNSCGRFTALRFEFVGERGKDSWGCRAWSRELSTEARLEGSEITIEMAKAEGWYGKNGSKWKTMPEQMLMYRAAAFWARIYAPELTMGLRTRDEAEDVGVVDGEVVVSPPRPPAAMEEVAAPVQQSTAEATPAPEPQKPEHPQAAADLVDAILRADSRAGLKELIPQIEKQSEPRKSELRQIYGQRAKELQS